MTLNLPLAANLGGLLLLVVGVLGMPVAAFHIDAAFGWGVLAAYAVIAGRYLATYSGKE